ncbi:MAG: YbjN domain-containing protein [Cyanobacteria bacterium J06588_5]
MAQFITRANYGLILGNFELDYTDGEIRYKTSLDVESDRLTPALTKNLISTNVTTMDQYLPGLLAFLEQQTPPGQAIKQNRSIVFLISLTSANKQLFCF